MATEEEVFYVDKITEAEVRTEGTRRNTKKVWYYHTVWEGYSESDTTWEPLESFKGSKYAVRHFWANADCGPRNHEQMSKFSPGEVVHLKQPSSKGWKKPGPGRSSVGLITGTQVFALWPETKLYYYAIVQKRSGARSYVVRFDEDESELVVPLKNMRACDHLREGDRVVCKTDKAEISEIREDGTIRAGKKVDYSTISISAYDVDADWNDRMLSHSDIVCAIGK
ncbi:hypothetical protein K438DRAFT_2022846 [Mycena galopus ATCC 62051]|nr:hypothetical protein K438DRAFT_2022846 [Mycena galopus ATCC 62051]